MGQNDESDELQAENLGSLCSILCDTSRILHLLFISFGQRGNFILSNMIKFRSNLNY